MAEYKAILERALKLQPVDRAHLIEGLMASMEKPDPDIEKLWDQEALRRYDAYKQNKIAAKDLDEVLRKFD